VEEAENAEKNTITDETNPEISSLKTSMKFTQREAKRV